MRKKVQCPYCLQRFSIEVFLEDGETQEIIYDCEICCHPIEIKFFIDTETQKIYAEANRSTGF